MLKSITIYILNKRKIKFDLFYDKITWMNLYIYITLNCEFKMEKHVTPATVVVILS